MEDELSSVDSIEELLKKVEMVFSSLQDRQKPIVSDMIMARIWASLSERQEEFYSFISKDVVEVWEKPDKHQASEQSPKSINETKPVSVEP